MSASSPRIGLMGYFGYGNFGNDASLEAMTAFLYRVCPDAELTCICVSPSGVNHDKYRAVVPMTPPAHSGTGYRLLNALLLKLPRLIEVARHAIKSVRKLDVVIVPGSGLLQDYLAKPWQAPITLYIWCLSARLSGKKLGFISVGAGASRNALSRWLLKSSAGLAHFRSYRDEASRNYMVGLGVGSNKDPLYPDLVYTRPANDVRRALDSQPVVVGVGLMTHLGWWGDDQGVYDTYIRKICEFCVRLLNEGYRVRILIGETTDRAAVDDVIRGVERQRPDAVGTQIVAEHACSQRDLMRQMSPAHAVVAMRFHNVVCALILGKPVVSIGLFRKADQMLAEVGMGEFRQTLEHLDVDLLYEQLQRLLADRAGYEAKIRQTLPTYHAQLEEQAAVIMREFLGGRANA
jgi:polysaccharide pyruvyl transferase WcaK-like protein